MLGVVLFSQKRLETGFFCFPQAFQLTSKGTHWSPQNKEDPWNILKLGWALRTSSTVLQHNTFMLRWKSQKYPSLTGSGISHDWLEHLTPSFSEGDLSSVCNYKLPALQIAAQQTLELKCLLSTSQIFSELQETSSTFCVDLLQDELQLFSAVRAAMLIDCDKFERRNR